MFWLHKALICFGLLLYVIKTLYLGLSNGKEGVSFRVLFLHPHDMNFDGQEFTSCVLKPTVLFPQTCNAIINL
jgi:hypothetical protein